MSSIAVSSSVLFVCLGNICRSPAAEGVFLQLLEKRGLQAQIKVDSAGTYGGHAGALPDPRMRKAAEARGITLTHQARQVTKEDLENFDWVVAMDHANFHHLRHLHHEPKARLVMMGAYLPAHIGGHHEEHVVSAPEVPDPYYGGAEGFAQVLDMLAAASGHLLKAVLHGQ